MEFSGKFHICSGEYDCTGGCESYVAFGDGVFFLLGDVGELRLLGGADAPSDLRDVPPAEYVLGDMGALHGLVVVGESLKLTMGL